MSNRRSIRLDLQHPVRLELQFDLQLPAFATVDRVTLYRTALDMCRWADDLGFDAINLPEHHTVENGYLPTPLVMAPAVAAVTNQVKIRLALLVPLYDPIRLAEEIAVADIISEGRLVPVLLAGYRAAEFESLGRQLKGRAKVLADSVEVLRKAWSGEPFEIDGRTVRVTPKPQRPGAFPITLGGGGPWTVGLAARVADGFRPTTSGAWAQYRTLVREAGRKDPGPWLGRGPIFLHVANDPDVVWDEVGRHVLHSVAQYNGWIRDDLGVVPTSADTYPEVASSVEDLRSSSDYRVVTPEDCVKLITGLEAGTVVTLHPLMGGISPDAAWTSLRLFADHVLPHLAPMHGGEPRPN